MDQQFQDARDQSRGIFKCANEMVSTLTEALWAAYECHHFATAFFDNEEELMRSEHQRVGLRYHPSPADHTRARLDAAIEPIEHALRAMAGDETFEDECARRISDAVERAGDGVAAKLNERGVLDRRFFDLTD